MPVALALGGAVLVLLLISRKSSTAAGKKNSGLGQAHTLATGVKAFPTGTIADSFSKIGSSLFGGSGTHAPTDPSIKPPSSVGPLIVPGSKNDPTQIPESSQVVTTLDENQGVSGIQVGMDTSPSVGPEDFSFDAGYSDD